MGELEGRVAIVTGGGRGLGRAHALLLAAEGARVVVNDVGADIDGGRRDATPAADVVDEIRAEGGEAVADAHDVADWDGGRRLVQAAVDTFGDLHVVVNNAGILRDRYLVNMTEQEWDEVIRVHVKGHFVPTRWAAAYWRDRTKAGHEVRASVVNTTSTSGLVGNPGQTNYGAAKAAIAAFTVIASQELVRYGVRVNAVAPAARTRMTENLPGLAEVVRRPEQPDAFDVWDPANAAPLVAYLATEACPVTGQVLLVQGGRISLFSGWTLSGNIDREDRWTIPDLAREVPRLLR